MYISQDRPEHRVGTAEGPAHLRIHRLGAHPILNHFLDRMTLPRILRSCLGSSRESTLDHAQTLTCLLHNILLSPGPLYRIAEWAHPIDPQALELSAAEKATLNDDRVARTLDVLASERSRSLFFRLALHLIRDFELDVSRIHQDTTSVTFCGQYRQSRRSPQITYGLNKDHRPDLKQLVFGVSVTADGAVPLLHEVHSGTPPFSSAVRLISASIWCLSILPSHLLSFFAANARHHQRGGPPMPVVNPATLATVRCS